MVCPKCAGSACFLQGYTTEGKFEKWPIPCPECQGSGIVSCCDTAGASEPLTDEDGEVRELTEEDFRGMRPIAEADPEMLEALKNWDGSSNWSGTSKA